MSSGRGNKIINVNNKPNSHKMLKLPSLNKLKMRQQIMLVVVFVVCLGSKAHHSFVSADEDGMETTTFGELLVFHFKSVMFNYCHFVVIFNELLNG